MVDQYKAVSKVYNKLSKIYSLGAIPRCRSSSITPDLAGLDVCFVGVGYGCEAVRAASFGAKVTVIDSSETMLNEFRAALDESDLADSVEIVHDDIFHYFLRGSAVYDVIVSNFFFNVFASEDLNRLIKLTISRIKTGGSLVVGDFHLHRNLGGWAGSALRSVQKLNWYFALIIFRQITANTWHQIHDYDLIMSRNGMLLESRNFQSVLGMPLYSATKYKKISHLELLDD